MAVKRAGCFFLDVEDRPGALAQFARQLRDAKINLKGLWGYSSGQGRGKIACVPQNSGKFLEGVKKLGLTTTQGVAFHVSGVDKAGALCGVLDGLEKAGINVQVLDAIGFGGRFGAYVWVDPKDVDGAGRVLNA